MIATEIRTYRLGEFHKFEGGGRQFLYLVPAGAIFEVDEGVAAVLDALSAGEAHLDDLLATLADRGYGFDDSSELLREMLFSRAIVTGEPAPEPVESAPAKFPLQSLVMNLTNQCNLACTYCYEFGEDKVATPEGKPKFMDLETAKASVDFLL